MGPYFKLYGGQMLPRVKGGQGEMYLGDVAERMVRIVHLWMNILGS